MYLKVISTFLVLVVLLLALGQCTGMLGTGTSGYVIDAFSGNAITGAKLTVEENAYEFDLHSGNTVVLSRESAITDENGLYVTAPWLGKPNMPFVSDRHFRITEEHAGYVMSKHRCSMLDIRGKPSSFYMVKIEHITLDELITLTRSDCRALFSGRRTDWDTTMMSGKFAEMTWGKSDTDIEYDFCQDLLKHNEAIKAARDGKDGSALEVLMLSRFPKDHVDLYKDEQVQLMLEWCTEKERGQIGT